MEGRKKSSQFFNCLQQILSIDSSLRDTWETFLLNIVCSLLVDSEKSPFYKKLIIPNIGSNFSPDTGFGRSTLNTTFHVGLQDISKDDVNRVVQLIDETFQEVAK